MGLTRTPGERTADGLEGNRYVGNVEVAKAKATNRKQEYGGVFTAIIESIDTTKGIAVITPFGVSPTGEKTINAKLTKLSGGQDETSGIMSTPSVGATCVCAFEYAQGGQNSAIILSYINGSKAGSAGLTPGDILLKTDRGMRLSLDNQKNVVELVDANRFGLSLINSHITLSSKAFNIKSFDTGGTELNFNNNNATITYETNKNSLRIKTKNFLQETSENHKASTTGNREDSVIGEFNLKAGNLTGDAVHQLTLIAGEKIMISTPLDIDTVSKNNVTTANLHIVRGSTAGSIVDFVNAGSITLAAGTANTTGAAVTTGAVPVASSKIQLTQAGLITVKNNASSTDHTPNGSILTDTKSSYSLSSVGPATLSSKAAMSLDTKAIMLISSKALMDIKTDAVMNITSKLAMNLKTEATMNITATGPINVSSTGFTLLAKTPVLGVQTITIFGPMYLIPG